jgi:hypothetical protein
MIAIIQGVWQRLLFETFNQHAAIVAVSVRPVDKRPDRWAKPGVIGEDTSESPLLLNSGSDYFEPGARNLSLEVTVEF